MTVAFFEVSMLHVSRLRSSMQPLSSLRWNFLFRRKCMKLQWEFCTYPFFLLSDVHLGARDF